VAIGTPSGFNNVSQVEKAYDPSFSTAIGLILWAKRIHNLSSHYKFNSGLNLSWLKNIKGFFKNLMP
jgi:hypothetical protein